MPSESVGDYLKAILQLGGPEDARVSTQALAEALGVRTPSVTGMLQKLSAQRPAFVSYEKHRGVHLTAAGKQRAWQLVRRHRLLERFLRDVLKYPLDEIHDEAERLEHFISERFEDRVAALLDDPQVDPHGHPIPAKHEAAAYAQETPLAEWPLDTPAAVTSVSDRDPAGLRDLDRLGLTPGAVVTVAERGGSSMAIRVGGHRGATRLTNDLARLVLVAPR